MAQKQQNQKTGKKKVWDTRRILMAILACVMVVLLLLPILTMAIPVAQAVTEDELREQIEALKGSASDVESKKEKLQSQLEQVQGQKDKAMQEKQLRDQELAYIDQQIANTESQIAYYDQLIEQETANLAEAQAKEEAQYELFCQRVRAMEEGGTVSYWAILFNASSFSDMLDKLVFVQDVMDYDNAVIEQLKADRQAVADALAALESSRTEQANQKTLLDQQRADQAVKVEEAAQVLKNLEDDVAEYERLLEEQAAEEARVNDEIAQREAELEELIRQNQIQFTVSNGWLYPLPTSCMTLTSAFGYRIHPITGRPHSHTGTDIAAPYGTPIKAVKSGVVTISEYGSSYGNYVVISHGDGTTSLYAHMSSRAVSAGDVVSQGDVIGYVGSTGNSTGNHLHLEIRVNGTRVDPEQYWPDLPFYRQYNT
ncbi:MAG: peptidoglycan DD-metalloendopeptidase family protein [Pseudoflavonifractor capillosus]|uniref:murein hydrolase activator EnvC family protein n=1 Tax=Pseudoflavonifractor capillosus TaxID=106588 RepID=UPI0023F98498|nr:peptidoglycan DD-metalloendopeptidase family protein [Pseudoflavonifractor capillosus]MCI5928126.1 peptidoglycan DD-metalloendopeptidase family protein [Pseudoflavonifractor capillosus]MDY4662278.1 peptidoglycan DD-metalloendopeptidase family protein [Pseudoflavonifractor capillosus]